MSGTHGAHRGRAAAPAAAAATAVAAGTSAVAPIDGRHEGAAFVVTITRPEAGNAIDVATAIALREALERAAHDDTVRGIVIAGSGRFFCAGGDVKRYRSLRDAAELDAAFGEARALLDQVEACDKPVIAAIDGYAIGGGCELALACDLRIAGPGARIGLTQAKVGIVPGWHGVGRLVEVVGRARAAEMLLSARLLDAAQALQIGLVHSVCDDPLAESLAFVERVAQCAPLAVAGAKRALLAAVREPAERARACADALLRELWFTDDHREAEDAFAGKRTPVFRGR